MSKALHANRRKRSGKGWIGEGAPCEMKRGEGAGNGSWGGTKSHSCEKKTAGMWVGRTIFLEQKGKKEERKTTQKGKDGGGVRDVHRCTTWANRGKKRGRK